MTLSIGNCDIDFFIFCIRRPKFPKFNRNFEFTLMKAKNYEIQSDHKGLDSYTKHKQHFV
jgi:hypothetical protein